jgi:peptidoglycan/xylan/chitin deacetylase (PgdA/CDA1 family)
VIGASALKRAVKTGLASPWGWRLCGPLLRPPGVIVLMYHRISRPSQRPEEGLGGLSVEIFAAQMRWLRDNCDPIGPDAIAERARRPSRVRPAVLVTFDDGYRDYYDLAYPVLKQLGIPSVVFLATSFIDQGGMLWTERVQWAARSTRQESVTLPWADGTAIPLPDAAAREALGERARAHLKSVPDAERQAALDRLLAALGNPPELDRQMLTWDEVRRTMDITHYGGHTHTHPILSRLSREQADTEIRTCRDRIAAETGRTPTTFAYPNGRPEDYSRETQEILRRHGFSVAFSTSEGIAGPDTDWMAIKRLPAEAADVPGFVWLASGLSRA